MGQRQCAARHSRSRNNSGCPHRNSDAPITGKPLPRKRKHPEAPSKVVEPPSGFASFRQRRARGRHISLPQVNTAPEAPSTTATPQVAAPIEAAPEQPSELNLDPFLRCRKAFAFKALFGSQVPFMIEWRFRAFSSHCRKSSLSSPPSSQTRRPWCAPKHSARPSDRSWGTTSELFQTAKSLNAQPPKDWICLTRLSKRKRF